jgi:hypothetical protein
MTKGNHTIMLMGLIALALLLAVLPVNAQVPGTTATGVECHDSAPVPGDGQLTTAPASSEQVTAAEATSAVDTKTTTGQDDKPAQGEKQAPPQKTAPAPASDDFNKFRVLVIPYVWFATTSTELKVGDRAASSVVTPGEAAQYLNAAFAARLEGSQGHWGGFIDVNSLRLGDTRTPNYRNVDMSFTSGINNYALFYRFKGSPVFDIYAGARTYDFNTNITIQPGRFLNGRTISRGNNWTDGIIGARMNAPLSKKFALIVDGDVGGLSAGSSSWELEGLVEWKLSDSFSLQGGYKSLYFERDWSGNRFDSLSIKSRMYGPMLKLQIGF